MRLDGRIAIVTGAARGIGEGVARVLAAEGAVVVGADVDGPGMARTADEIAADGGRCRAVTCDVGELADIRRTVAHTIEAFGGVDILVNNAIYIWPGCSLAEVTEEQVEILYRTGPLASLRFMQACLPAMQSARRGSIVNVGSRGAIDGNPTMGPYAMAKEAIRGLTRVAAREWGEFGIRVNTLVPVAESPAMQAFRQVQPEYLERRMESIPLGRFGDCEQDIGRAALFLASDDSRYVTGHTLMVDGGSCTF